MNNFVFALRKQKICLDRVITPVVILMSSVMGSLLSIKGGISLRFSSRIRTKMYTSIVLVKLSCGYCSGNGNSLTLK
jgi:hypothetical protein